MGGIRTKFLGVPQIFVLKGVYKRGEEKRRGGFTFIEVLAAMIFMAVLIPVVMQGLILVQRSVAITERRTIAAQLGANLLNEMIVTEQWEQETGGSGDWGEEWPGFRWEMTLNPWSEDEGINELTLTVYYPSHGQEESISLTTLVPQPTVETQSSESEQTNPQSLSP